MACLGRINWNVFRQSLTSMNNKLGREVHHALDTSCRHLRPLSYYLMSVVVFDVRRSF